MDRCGDVKITKQIRRWQACEECGYPAKYKIAFLLEGFRHNPASSGYGRDDCSWCSDLEIFACEKHKRTLDRAPQGYHHGSCIFTLRKLKHMGFYWETVPA